MTSDYTLFEHDNAASNPGGVDRAFGQDWDNLVNFAKKAPVSWVLSVSGGTYYAINVAEGKGYSDTDFYTLVDGTVLPAIASAGVGAKISIKPGNYVLTNPIDLTDSHQLVWFVGEGRRDAFGLVGSGFGVQIGATTAMDYLFKFTEANGSKLDNVYLYGSDVVNDGVVLEDVKVPSLNEVSIDGFARRGLYCHAVASLQSTLMTKDLQIRMAYGGAGPVDLRGIVFEGVSTSIGPTHGKLIDTRIVMKQLGGAVNSSIGVDCVNYTDNVWFSNGLRIAESPSDGTLTAAVALGSEDYSNYVGVRNNVIDILNNEQRLYPGVICGISDDQGKFTNKINTITYSGMGMKARIPDLEIASYGQVQIFDTNFESLDGYVTSGTGVSGSSVGFDATDGFPTIKTGTSNANTVTMSKRLTPDDRWFWLRVRRMRIGVQFTSNSAQTFYLVAGSTGTGRHVGFKVVNGAVYGSNADNTTESLTTDPIIAAIDTTKTYILEASYTGNASYKVATYWGYESGQTADIIPQDVTTHCPDQGNGTTSGKLVNVTGQTSDSTDKQLKIGYWQVRQYG